MELKQLTLGLVISLVIGSLVIYSVASNPKEITRLKQELADLKNEYASLIALLNQKEDDLNNLRKKIDQLETDKSNLEYQIQNLSTVKGREVHTNVLFLSDHKVVTELIYWIGRANETIQVMVTSISDHELANALIEAFNKGIDVKVLVDESSNNYYVSRENFDYILFNGVDIRTKARSFSRVIRHQAMIVDGDIIITGSFIWAVTRPSSATNSFLILRENATVQSFLDEFDHIWHETVSLLPEPLQPWPELETGVIFISEIEPDPPGNDLDNEWIELYNPWNFTVDISGYRLFSYGVDNLTISQGTNIGPSQFLVISLPGEWINNEFDLIKLYNSQGEIIDSVSVHDEDQDDDQTIQRVANRSWNIDYHTKGRANRR